METTYDALHLGTLNFRSQGRTWEEGRWVRVIGIAAVDLTGLDEAEFWRDQRLGRTVAANTCLAARRGDAQDE
jgi:hypothetical protein